MGSRYGGSSVSVLAGTEETAGQVVGGKEITRKKRPSAEDDSRKVAATDSESKKAKTESG